MTMVRFIQLSEEHMNGFLTYLNMTDLSDMQGQGFILMQIEMLTLSDSEVLLCLTTQQIFNDFILLIQS